MKAKEFIENTHREAYKYFGTTYFRPRVALGDLDEQMNGFFEENIDIEIIKIEYVSCIRDGINVSKALLIYKEKMKIL